MKGFQILRVEQFLEKYQFYVLKHYNSIITTPVVNPPVEGIEYV